jgi:hypothetical protein
LAQKPRHTLPGGDLPANTNGGNLSGVYRGMYGVFQMIEAIVQLRGAAGKRQVKDAEVALCHGNGDHLSSQSTVIWAAQRHSEILQSRGYRKLACGVQRQTWQRGNLQKNDGGA